MTTMMRLLLVPLLLPLHLVSTATAGSSSSSTRNCKDGACPSSSSERSSPCGLWLGPSHIKQAFQHGFGYGVFTGKAIPKGTAVEPLYNGAKGQAGEPLLPLWGAEPLYRSHSPLREYLWDEDNFPEVAVEYPAGLTALFVPGLASIAPCTSNNFNLKVLGPGLEDGRRHSVASSTSFPDTGAFALRANVSFVAVRDIAAGEELTLECDDADFDGGAYFLSQYEEGTSMICLDQNLRVQESPIQGHGLFAKRTLRKDAVVLSSPALPVHAKELQVDNPDINEDQLLLNYCYGHPDTDLLWLPFGPLVNYINHSPQPNARLRWRTDPQQVYDPAFHHNWTKTQPQQARQQYHHPELFLQPAQVVATTHGKTLILDIVPLRTISPNEEITIDYGEEWTDEWEKHVKTNHARSMVANQNKDYVSAEAFNGEDASQQYKTILEQLSNPYPDNLETFCFYAMPEDDDSLLLGDDHAHKHRHVVHKIWDSTLEHDCFRPCQILERSSNDNNISHYTIHLQESDDSRVIDHCILDDHDQIIAQVPGEAIRIVDRPFSTNVFSHHAFRMEMGLPDDMVPASWKRKFRQQLRGGGGGGETTVVGVPPGEEFKRKKQVLEIKAKGGLVSTAN